MYSSFFLRERSRTFPHLLHILTFVRSMGGGPRTFPGGLNKWQWKRHHEKKAREKEKKLLEQEKQLYQARVRSQIRSKLAAGQSDTNPHSDSNPPKYSPITPQDHIKALADRFMKEGAEDLWNEADGPIKSPRPDRYNRPNSAPIDLRKLIDRRNVSGDRESGNSINLNNTLKPRHYSVDARSRMRSRFNFRRNESSTSDDDDSKSEGGLVRPAGGRARWPRFGSRLTETSDGDDEEEEEEEEGRGNVKKLMSSAALGKYDAKITKRVPLKFLEQEDDLLQHVEAIQNGFNKWNLAENVVEKSEEESILSQKRFDECNVSPLTVKALTSAGYVQMTRVQEATLSACLDERL